MAVRVRQQQLYTEVTVAPEIQQQPVKRHKIKKATKFEKMLYIVFIVAVTSFAILILNKQASIQTVNIEIQKIEEKADEISKENVDLTVSVKDLSRYERIWEKAQALGLTQNGTNVKVVPGE